MKKILAPVMLSALLLTACSSNDKDKHKKESPATDATTAAVSTPVSEENLNAMTESWPEPSKKAIDDMRAKYGLPSAVTEDMVVWDDIGKFEKAIVTKEQVNHMFPVQHNDVLMQTVNYRVPLDKVTALNKFDGSLIIDRTKGELSARNEKEEMNILALNLAHQIVGGDLTVEKAREEYKKHAEAIQLGVQTPMYSSLNFEPQSNTGDPDTLMQGQSEAQAQEEPASDSEFSHDHAKHHEGDHDDEEEQEDDSEFLDM